ncbi:CSC1-like protein HYP1 [Nematostella vectensis]|uniref:CSC1-like protein HYP1 n=1 Tax=Nematostella vectensis TaxID=45351 RepID=UPI0020773269|nr:CSC1-like protein HYP1 [Nematostella vectensis]
MNGTNKTSPDNQANSVGVFLVSLAINGGFALILFTLFSFLRLRIKRLYSPRLLLNDTLTPQKYNNSFFGWLLLSKAADDDTIFEEAGIDALVYMRFIKLCIKISIVLLPYGIVVLIPLNVYGGLEKPLSGLDVLTMSNLAEKASKGWAHLIAVWGYTLIICYLLYQEWGVYISYRQKHLAVGLPNQYAVFVRELSPKLLDKSILSKYMEALFPGQVSEAIIVQNLKKWVALIGKHDAAVLSLEKARHQLLTKGDRPKHRPKCCGEKTDSITFHENNLKVMQGRLEDELRCDHPSIPCAFIVFKSLQSASVAAQVLWDEDGMLMNVQPAPDKDDVIWGNLTVVLASRLARSIVSWGIIFALMFFWAIPTGFVSSLIELDNLEKYIPSITSFIGNYPFLNSLIKGYLSSVVLTLFFLILPWIMHLITRREGLASRTEEDKSVLGRLFLFKIINQFLFVALASSALSKLEEMIESPKKIPEFLARTLPSQSTFFIMFIVLNSLTGFSFEIIRVFDLLVLCVTKCISRTPREKRTSWEPPRANYDVELSEHMLTIMIGLTYCVLAPLIVLFVLLYFILGYIVWIHQVLCVYTATYNSGGQLWPVIFERMVASLVIFHILMVGFFGLKKFVIVPLLVLPLPVITILFYLFMVKYFYRASAHLSQEMASRVSPDANAIQLACEVYRRKNKVPSLFALSTDPPEMEGESEGNDSTLRENQEL